MSEVKSTPPSTAKKLVTAALPYANGSIHIGHMLEHFQTDFWVRFQRMQGVECLHICADDTHGTPIMVRARKEGITPEELIERSRKEHMADFEDFEIGFDHYSSTHTEANRKISEEIFLAMKEGNHIDVRSVEQSYCEHDKMFLPDRFVVGTCPKCGAEEQYGDACDSCGTTYSPTDLKDSKCSICGNKPVLRESDHVFFQLGHFTEFLSQWVPAHTQKEISNKLKEWLGDELRDWDISRDAPYFGFEIPGFKDKYFYVWVDAPVGYISATQEWCEKNGRDLSEFWQNDDCPIYHFIGKDIVYFHTLFWPAMLQGSKFNTPEQVFVHGFLTVNGEKMSKSKGTFINARTYLNHLDPLALRFYMATKLTPGVDDLDMNLDDFMNRVNSEYIGKITNVASRGAQMLHKKIDGKLGVLPEDGRKLVEEAQSKASVIAELYEAREFNKAMIEIRQIAEMANKYFDEKEPWKLIKEDVEETRKVLTTAINLFRQMAIYLKPILPSYVAKVETLLREEPYTWQSVNEFLEEREIEKYEHLAKRIEGKDVEAMIESGKQE